MNGKYVFPISVIILTLNEEKNIQGCLKSIEGFFDEIIIVDSGSTDKTLETAKKYTDLIYSHEYITYSSQRNWAMKNIKIRNEWVLHLDADHRVTPELIAELREVFQGGLAEKVDGFMLSRKIIFMGKWIRFGGLFPCYHMPLFRKSKGMCEEKLYDQHYLVNGNIKILKGTIYDIITDSLDNFITRHNHWASLEAQEWDGACNKKKHAYDGRISGNKIEKRRFFKKIFYHSPIFLRSFLYFIYRYILKFGFLDGKEGLIFHTLQGFWFRFLVDAKIYEKKIKNAKTISQRNNQDL